MAQWNIKVKIESLDRGNVQVKNRWVVGDEVTVQIEPHATVNMLKQRVALLVAAHTKHQTMRNADGPLDDLTKLESCVADGGQILLDVQQPAEEAEPDVVLSDDEDLWPADEAAPEALPDAAGMAKELTDEEQDEQNALKQQAAELLEDGDRAGALPKLTEAILVGAPTALMLCKRAELLLKLKRPKAAEQDAGAALGVNPDSAKAYKLRGKARRFLGDYAGSVEDLNTAQKIDYDDDVADLHAYVQKRVKKLALKEKQDTAKAAEGEK